MAAEVGSASSGTSEATSRQQLAVQRRNLLGICRMCIKSLVDKSVFEVISDDCPHLFNFCNVMDNIFMHRVQARWSFFGGSVTVQYWHMITRLAPSITVGSVQDMEGIQTDIGRGRAWIRLALVQKKLPLFMTTLLSKINVLRTMYAPGAFLLSEELTELSGTLKCLEAIDFNLCLRGHDFDSSERMELDYSPYLEFNQSEQGRADDSAEERKLLAPRTHHNRTPTFTRGEDQEDGGSRMEGSVSEGETLAQLREMLKTEREQKNYFEELVTVRDTQLSQAQAELRMVSEDTEKQKREFQDIVLELQQQLEQKQVELRGAQQTAQSQGVQSTNSSSDRAATGTSSNNQRKRTTSFSVFSSFLGSGE